MSAIRKFGLDSEIIIIYIELQRKRDVLNVYSSIQKQ